MSKTAKLALVTDNAPADSTAAAREVLRAAIAERKDLEDKLAGLTTALGGGSYVSSWEPRRDADRALKAAQNALQTAKDEAAENMASAAIGRTRAAPANVEAARRRLVEAEDAAEVARHAETTMQTQVKEIEGLLNYAKDKAQKAAEAVLRESSAVGRLVEEVTMMQRELFAKARALEFLMHKNIAQTARVQTGQFTTSEAPATLAMGRFRSPIATWRELLTRPECRGEQPWADALAALLIDADAPLPA